MRQPQTGFSLIELAIVLFLVGLLIGGFMVPLSTQLEQDKIRRARHELAEIKEALIGFAIAYGRLPCPSTASPVFPEKAGAEHPGGGGACDRQHGFVPVVTLGLRGTTNEDGLLIDPWGSPYLYSVTNTDVGTPSWDFTTTGRMQAVGVGNLAPDLVICAASPATDVADAIATIHTDCGTERTLSYSAPAVIFSQGPGGTDRRSSKDEVENADITSIAKVPPFTKKYWVPRENDTVFVHREYSDQADDEFDDIVEWISPHILYARMVAAEQLP